MPKTNTLKEAARVMAICNACRYCEGFCAVFPAMELRRTFTNEELKYMANLCHNCRGCYYACQYAPPHEFDLNFPRIMAELRQETYAEFSWPSFLKGLLTNNGRKVALLSIISVLVMLFLVVMSQGSAVLFTAHEGPGSFYQVVPYMAILAPFSILGIFIVFGLWKGVRNMWDITAGPQGKLFSGQANIQAVWDVLRLRYLDGGGHGCNYPDDRFSMVRRNFHHAIFYGFLLCLASTTIALVYDHFLSSPAPYPLLSWPVMLGTIGGISICIGSVGMLYLRQKMDREPASPLSFGMDVAFTSLLFLTSLSGLLLLLLRSSSLMGLLLVVHLGFVLAFFLTVPYGKFLHVVYRYTALVRNAYEQRQDTGNTQH